MSTPTDQPPRILVVEDEGVIALGVELVLQAHGYEVVGPAASLAEAFGCLDRLEGAVLDVRLPDGRVFPLAEELERRGVPYVFVTAVPHEIPERFAAAPRLRKPYEPQQLLQNLDRLLPRH